MTGSGAIPTQCVTGDDGKIVLSVENYALHPVNVKQGEVLGTLEPVQTVHPSCVNALSADQVTVNPGMYLTVERENRLFAELDTETTLNEQEGEQLQAIVSSFKDVFAMDQFELGRTDLIKHSIDTGGHGPVNNCHIIPHSLCGQRWRRCLGRC